MWNGTLNHSYNVDYTYGACIRDDRRLEAIVVAGVVPYISPGGSEAMTAYTALNDSAQRIQFFMSD